MDTESSPPESLQHGDSTTPSAGGTSAYLIVHAEPSDHGGRRGRHGLTPLQRLRALYWSGSVPAPQAALMLT